MPAKGSVCEACFEARCDSGATAVDTSKEANTGTGPVIQPPFDAADTTTPAAACVDSLPTQQTSTQPEVCMKSTAPFAVLFVDGVYPFYSLGST